MYVAPRQADPLIRELCSTAPKSTRGDYPRSYTAPSHTYGKDGMTGGGGFIAKGWIAIISGLESLMNLTMAPHTSQCSLEIAYKGEALDDGSIDYKDFAYAVLSMGNLFQEANQVANGNDVLLNMRVHQVSEGSFEVAFEVVQQVVQLPFKMATMADAATLYMLLFGSDGLFQWRKINGNKEVLREKHTEYRREEVDEGVRLKFLGFEFTRSRKLHKEGRSIVYPLDREGVNALEVRRDGEVTMRVNEEDVDNIVSPLGEEPKTEVMRVVTLPIAVASFTRGSKWALLGEDGKRMWVTIRDQEFLSRIYERKESFSEGDRLKCRIKTTEYIVDGKQRLVHELLAMLKHYRIPGLQDAMSLEEDSGNEE